MPVYQLPDIGGGLNNQSPVAAADNEMVQLFNFIPKVRSLSRRPGVQRLTSAPYGTNTTSAFALRDGTGVWTVIVGTRTGLAKLDGGQLVALPSNSGPSIFSDLQDPWDFHQYSDVGYGLRSGVGLKRFTKDFFGDAGIAPPPAAPVITEGAAGNAEAGDFYPVYTYYNTLTGVESNPSPPGIKLTKAASKKFNWANLVPSSNGQVDAMRLYRAGPIGAGASPGEYFFATDKDNFTATHTEDVVINDLGDPVSFDNGLPPGSLLFGDKFMLRLFATDGTDLFFSEEGLFECWASDSVIEVFRDDGHRISAVRAFGDRLIVGKTNKIHYVVPTGVRKFQRFTLSDRHGCWSHASMKVAESHLFWFGGGGPDDPGAFYRSGGTGVDDISDTKIANLLGRVPDDMKQFISAEIYEPLHLYIASIPLDGSTTNKAVAVHNYRTGKWCVFDHPSDAPSYLAEVFDEDYGKQIYATFYDGHLYRYLTGTNDFGNAINARFKTKAFQFGRDGLRCALHRLWMLYRTNGQPTTITAYLNGESAPFKSRVVPSTSDNPSWKIYSLKTTRRAADMIQVGVQYTGEDEFEIDAMALEYAEIDRHRRTL